MRLLLFQTITPTQCFGLPLHISEYVCIISQKSGSFQNAQKDHKHDPKPTKVNMSLSISINNGKSVLPACWKLKLYTKIVGVRVMLYHFVCQRNVFHSRFAQGKEVGQPEKGMEQLDPGTIQRCSSPNSILRNRGPSLLYLLS